MRVIAGSVRGFRLQAPPGQRTRPTADRVKEALFNILAPYLSDRRVLDLFAGSGALGIEALSRGAGRAVFVEKDAAALRALRANLASTGMVERAEVLPLDVSIAIKNLQDRDEKFDLVFLDPPYRQGLIDSTLEKLAARPLLAPHGLVVAESSEREPVPDVVAGFKCYRRETYGDTRLHFFHREK
ncbi:MAG: 16S rRNA (guanine(966)-N(2))-methyltransferase RsmD [Syntrophomonadaceae bacterium]|nr:16S rRNA (guanine(966)-N(2))-methyltransferase RsmD [Syntrophomonadaceae bacterium]